MSFYVIEILEGRIEEPKSEHQEIKEAIAIMVNWQYHNPGRSFKIKKSKE